MSKKLKMNRRILEIEQRRADKAKALDLWLWGVDPSCIAERMGRTTHDVCRLIREAQQETESRRSHRAAE